MAELNIIRIKNASFYAYHGAVVEEQNLGGKFEVDLDLYCDLLPAAETDSLRKTVDYEKVYAHVSNAIHSKKNYLIEALAHTIARGIIQEFSSVEQVTIRVRKPHPPVKGVIDYVEVEMTERR
jgi:7,8-dihydroneopterin aldolase/epimerase/oxygenase